MSHTPEQALERAGVICAAFARSNKRTREIAQLAATPFRWRDPTTIPPREWLYGHHLIRRFLSTTVAPGGVGKSSLTITEALAMVTGRPLLDIGVYGGAMRVWLWNLEDPADELDRRIMAACLHFGIQKADLGNRLFVDSARLRTLCTAVQEKNGTKVLRPVTDGLVAELQAHKIDVLIVDPFVSSHKVPENDNGAIDAVAKEWARVADAADCAIELVHHTKKLAGAEATAEASRGAVALVNAARDARAVNRMSVEQAAEYGLENERTYFRVMSDKANLAPPPDKSDWYRLVSVPLGNGDDVGVVERWTPPDATTSATLEDLRAAQKIVAAGSYRKDIQSAAWVGKAVAEAMTLDLDAPKDKRRVKALLSLWIKNGAFRVVTKQDERRRLKPFVEVAEQV